MQCRGWGRCSVNNCDEQSTTAMAALVDLGHLSETVHMQLLGSVVTLAQCIGFLLYIIPCGFSYFSVKNNLQLHRLP